MSIKRKVMDFPRAETDEIRGWEWDTLTYDPNICR